MLIPKLIPNFGLNQR